MSKLAIHGGPKAIPDGAISGWPAITDVDRKYVMASLEQSNHAFGPNCIAFEAEYAEWNKNKFAITTNSGTAALHMGVAACGCGAGDEVIVTAYSWSSSATCILHANAIPVFVDIDFDTINMDVAKIEAAITPRTKAILVVHLHGLATDMDAIMKLARKHKLKVIEDACQAHGATFNGKKVGTFGDCAAFSFNQNKSLCSGEGGMFVTDNEEILNNARMVWNFGETRTPAQSRDYHAYAVGWMYRNNDLTAAFGRAQLTCLTENIAAQRRNAAALTESLRGTKGIILPTEPKNHEHTFYNYTIRIDSKALGWNGAPAKLRDAMMKALQAEGTQVGIWQQFILPDMTVFKAKNAFGKGSPWCLGEPVDYDAKKFPIAQQHTDSHFGMTYPLRAPNTPKTAQLVGEGIRKVFENVNQLDVSE
jgi:perosamine synthetase